MTIHEIPRSEWPAFFERFTREHRAWLGTIHGIEQGLPVTCIPAVAVESVTLEDRPPGSLVRLQFANGISLCAPEPRAVRVQAAEDGSERALEVVAAEDALIRLGFRATARPEQLDGLAPGEMIPETCASR